MLEGDGDLLLWEEDGVAEHPVRRLGRRAPPWPGSPMRSAAATTE